MTTPTSYTRGLVSIGLPVRNGAERMRRAVDSLLGQTDPNFELIISDNASTDETWRIAQQYASRDRRVRTYRQSEDIGQQRNFRFVLDEARGEYFMWAADDDRRYAGFIATLKRALEQNPGCAVAMCSYERFYEDGTRLGVVSLTGEYAVTGRTYAEIARHIFLSPLDNSFIYGLFRREFLERLLRRGMPPSRFDRVLFAEAALAAPLCSVPDVLYAKQSSRMAIAVRYRNDGVGRAFLKSFSYLRFIGAMWWRLMTSPLIPAQRKLLVFGPLGRFLWRRKRKIARDLARGFGIV